MSNFKKIDEARKLLGLDESATLQEIKESYRKLALKYHPDRCKEKNKKNCVEMFKKINNANNVLIVYCMGYRYSFKEKDVKGGNTIDKDYYEHLKRFYDDWWGDLDL